MPAPVDLPPLICRDFTAWPLGGGQFVGAYLNEQTGRYEVLHLAYGRRHDHGTHARRAAAEAEAHALAVLAAAQQAITETESTP